MATNLKSFDSFGGFSVGTEKIINENKDILNVNSLQVRNNNYTDCTTTSYILRGINSTILSLDDDGTQISIPSNTINFITSNIVGVNSSGLGFYSIKFESCVSVDSLGNVTEISNLSTIIKDSVPTGQVWTVTPFDSGSANRYSYTVTRAGSIVNVKWIANVQIVSVAWT